MNTIRRPVNLLQYRLGVVGVMTRKDGKVLIFNRTDFQDGWQFPQGGIEKDENPDQAVLREIKEETGISSDKLFFKCASSLFIPMDIPAERRSQRLIDNNWIGHAQIWHLFYFDGTDQDINFSEEQIYKGFEWVEPAEAAARIVSFKKPAYTEGLKQLGFELTFS